MCVRESESFRGWIDFIVGEESSLFLELLVAGLGDRGSNSVVESQPSKLLVAGSIPVSRSIFGDVSQTSLVISVWRLVCR